MRRKRVLASALRASGGHGPLVLAGAVLLAFALPAEAQHTIENRLRARVEAGLTTESFDVMDGRIHARETLRRFYPARDFAPVWITDDGPTPDAEAFMAWLETGPAAQGLRSEHYHLDAIETLQTDRVGALVDLELALSDAFLIAGSHFLAGRLNPETLDAEWVANRRHRDLAPLLAETGSGAGSLGVYRATASHGPLLHVDARGRRARWGLLP